MDLYPQHEEQKKFAMLVLGVVFMGVATFLTHKYGAWSTLAPAGLFLFMWFWDYSILPNFFPQVNMTAEQELEARFVTFLTKQNMGGEGERRELLREVGLQREKVARLEASQKEVLSTIASLVRLPPVAPAQAPHAPPQAPTAAPGAPGEGSKGGGVAEGNGGAGGA